jgi:transcriptional regulator with XRE-family HTH domain
MRLGERLRRLRKKRHFNAELLANSCGVKAGAYRRWERNETEPSVSQAIQLAQTYQMTIDEMLFGSDEGGSVVSVDVEPGQEVTVRISGNEAQPKVSYQPEVKLENSILDRETKNKWDAK